ncbi:MAG TPA: addiction module protein [Pseudomonadota bacterium]|nr:addiction module protein [Pseudomonadota bacterium]
MSEQAQAIYDSAMRLSVGERSALVERLLRSLDDDALSDGELDELTAHDSAELRLRVAEIERGQVQGIPWAEVDARIRKITGE